MIKDAFYSYASQSGKIAQSFSLAGYTLVINETSILDSLLINRLPYEATKSFTSTEQSAIETTHFSHKPLASSTVHVVYINTLSNSIQF